MEKIQSIGIIEVAVTETWESIKELFILILDLTLL
jgi:hypothetical protein